MSNFIYTIKVLNSECENALIDFPFHDYTHTWINEYQLLFNLSFIAIQETEFAAIQKQDKLFIKKLVELYQAETKNL